VLAIILLLFGAKRISELAKGLGNGVREFKKGTEHGDEVDKEGKARIPGTNGCLNSRCSEGSPVRGALCI
jgi:sec-independent protein translocase protein TatA